MFVDFTSKKSLSSLISSAFALPSSAGDFRLIFRVPSDMRVPRLFWGARELCDVFACGLTLTFNKILCPFCKLFFSEVSKLVGMQFG